MKYRDIRDLIGGAVMLAVLALPVLIWLMPPADAAPYEGESYSAVLPPCLHEDGSGQEGCVWRANVYGNGSGRSSIQWSGDDHEYISHKRAKRIVREWRNQNCERITRRDWSCPRRAWNLS